MRVRITCPHCRRPTELPSRQISGGTELVCPVCAARFPCNTAILREALHQLQGHGLDFPLPKNTRGNAEQKSGARAGNGD